MSERILIAHRGLSAVAPENTLAAFEAAAHAGIDWIETDVDITAAGQVLVCHDPTGYRTTSYAGDLYDLSPEQAAHVDAGGWFDPRFRGQRLPTLAALVDAIERLNLHANIELKPLQRSAADGRALVEQVLRACRPISERVLFSSFNPLLLRHMHQVDEDAPIALLIEEYGLQMGWRATAEWVGASHIHPDEALLSPALVAAFHDAGLRVNAWTVNTRMRAHQLFNFGVDGIISNCPDRMGDLAGTID